MAQKYTREHAVITETRKVMLVGVTMSIVRDFIVWVLISPSADRVTRYHLSREEARLLELSSLSERQAALPRDATHPVFLEMACSLA